MLASIEKQVEQLSAAHPAGFIVRLHILGDFPTVSYAQFWVRLVHQYSALHVFGFTAHIRTSQIGTVIEAESSRWDRMRIRFSDDPKPERATAVIYPKRRFGRPSGRVDGGIVCPQESDDTATCGNCGLCWAAKTAKDRIFFIAH